MDRTTEQKTEYITEHGYTITGFILTHGTNGKRAFIDHGRVKWFTAEEAMEVLGHSSDTTEETDNG